MSKGRSRQICADLDRSVQISYAQHISNVYISNLLQIFYKPFSNSLRMFFKCLAGFTFFVNYK